MDRLRSLALFGALILLLAGCSLFGEDATSYDGLVSFGFEVSNLSPCDRDEDWWVTGPAASELVDRYYDVAGENPGATIYARVRGDLSGLGEYGHVGGSDREIEVEEVIEVRVAGADECR